jgi:hypothetical protein
MSLPFALDRFLSLFSFALACRAPILECYQPWNALTSYRSETSLASPIIAKTRLLGTNLGEIRCISAISCWGSYQILVSLSPKIRNLPFKKASRHSASSNPHCPAFLIQFANVAEFSKVFAQGRKPVSVIASFHHKTDPGSVP